MAKFTLQEYISIGYLYLFVLGMLTDVIYYQFLGIRILDYSGVSDVLLSPINLLTNHIILPVFLLAILAFTYAYQRFVVPRMARKNPEKAKKALTPQYMVLTAAFFLMMLFLGLGIGRGIGTRERLLAGDLHPDHLLVFQDQSQIQARILGQNTSYIFYLIQGQTTVQASPLAGNIRYIRRLTP